MSKMAKKNSLSDRVNRLKSWAGKAGVWFLLTVLLLLSAGNPSLAEKASAEAAATDGVALSREWK